MSDSQEVEDCIGFGPERPAEANTPQLLARTRGCVPAPVCRHGLEEGSARWKGRRTDSDGICGDAAHAARVSDHNPGYLGMAHAFDLSHDPAHGLDTYDLANKVRLECKAGRETRVKYIISNRRIASGPDWEWRPYTGQNPHDHHMHLSVRDGVESSAASWWGFIDGGAVHHDPPHTWGKYLHPMVGAFTPGGTMAKSGYYIIGEDGGVFCYGGGAIFHGSTGGTPLNKPVVGGVAHPSGNGYWLVASDGGVFAFGNAQFFGSTGALRLMKPVVGMAATPSGNGYVLVAADGGVFCYGDAEFHGSTAQTPLNAPVSAIVLTKSGHGYWMVAEDGGVFAFGDAVYSPSALDAAKGKRIIGLSVTSSEKGYWLLADDCTVIPRGDAAGWAGPGKQAYKATHLLTSDTGGVIFTEDGGAFGFGPAPDWFGSAA